VKYKLPNLQVVGEEALIFGDPDAWAKRAKNVGTFWKLEDSVTKLFVAFCVFYTKDFDWVSEVVSIRLGKRLKADDDEFAQLRGRFLMRLHIEDPIELGRGLQDVLQPDNEQKLFIALKKQVCAMYGIAFRDSAGSQSSQWQPWQSQNLQGGIVAGAQSSNWQSLPWQTMQGLRTPLRPTSAMWQPHGSTVGGALTSQWQPSQSQAPQGSDGAGTQTSHWQSLRPQSLQGRFLQPQQPPPVSPPQWKVMRPSELHQAPLQQVLAEPMGERPASLDHEDFDCVPILADGKPQYQ